MKILLDTQCWLWWLSRPDLLDPESMRLIRDRHNDVIVSVVSTWEIAIKVARGRLTLPEPPGQYVAERMRLHRFSALPIELSHALEVYRLPDIHQDPFDRLLIAQCQLEDMPILSGDSKIGRYQVEVIW